MFLLTTGILSQPANRNGNLNSREKQLSGFSNDVKNHKCGFPQVLQTVFSQNENVYKKFDNYLSQQIPLDLVYRSPSGHIIFHYTLTGLDAIPDYDRNQNGISDYLEFAGKSFDRAWEIEIDSLKFKPPPDSAV